MSTLAAVVTILLKICPRIHLKCGTPRRRLILYIKRFLIQKSVLMKKEWKPDLWNRETGLNEPQNLETTVSFEHYWNREDPSSLLDDYDPNLCVASAKRQLRQLCKMMLVSLWIFYCLLSFLLLDNQSERKNLVCVLGENSSCSKIIARPSHYIYFIYLYI